MRSISIAALVISIFLTMAGAAHAERWVVVNGLRLNLDQIQLLEGISCRPIPNGAYWLDTGSGIWGYAGDPRPQGHIKDGCTNSQRRPSLSERGLLYSPGELLR
jgi:hypothetical protein